jgi:hypothetical protein
MTPEEMQRTLRTAVKIQSFGAPDIKDRDVLDFWFRLFKDCNATLFERVLSELVLGEKFPSIATVMQHCGLRASNPEDVARTSIGRIREAIGRFGSWNEQAAKAYVGDVGWHFVINAGGWQAICAAENQDRLDFQLNEAFKRGLPAIKSGNISNLLQ